MASIIRDGTEYCGSDGFGMSQQGLKMRCERASDDQGGWQSCSYTMEVEAASIGKMSCRFETYKTP